MLNKEGQRELAYVVSIDAIKPIPGRDKVECAHVGGWTIMVRKDQFKPGDLGIYFEIDSKVPATEPFEFLASKSYKIKTQKYALKDENGNKIGQFWSQGLLMSAEDFGGICYQDGDGQMYLHFGVDSYFKENYDYKVGDFLTEKLGVTYYDPIDNKRKSNGIDKYKKMASRHPKLFQNPIIKWIYKRNWGKKLLFIFFGGKKTSSWPAWVQKTDEERIENLPHWLEDKCTWVATEKVDGTSTTFTLRRKKYPWEKHDYRVCSRNVCFDRPGRNCYYDTNVYLEMSEKYHMEDILTDILENDSTLDFVTIQAETYGASIQKRDYSMKDHDMAVFNLIFGFKDGSKIRFNPMEMTGKLREYNIPCVPIINTAYILPDTIEELREYVDSEPSAIDGQMKEGIVFRSLDGERSFKCVSPNFLMKYHNG